MRFWSCGRLVRLLCSHGVELANKKLVTATTKWVNNMSKARQASQIFSVLNVIVTLRAAAACCCCGGQNAAKTRFAVVGEEMSMRVYAAAFGPAS